MEKTTAIIITLIVSLLSFVDIQDWTTVGIYANCSPSCRFIYPFFHANLLHAILNAWCLLSIVFIYNVSIWRLFTAYMIAVTIPINTLYSELSIEIFKNPTVGLSGIVFVLFGSISFQVLRKWYYQCWMLLYLVIGFLYPNTNGWIHLYCYIAGFIIALLNKPIKVKNAVV